MTRHDYETGPLRLVLVDDHEFARAAVATSLAAQPGLEVVGEAGSVAVARALVELVEPDVAILDLNLPDGNGGESSIGTLRNGRNFVVSSSPALSRNERRSGCCPREPTQ